ARFRRDEDRVANRRVLAPGDPAVRVRLGAQRLDDRVHDRGHLRPARILGRRLRPPLAQSHVHLRAPPQRGKRAVRPRLAQSCTVPVEGSRRAQMMRIDRRLVGFGLFLVTVGIVMIAVRQGLIPDETARRAWNLWPLLLIGTGLSMILAGRPGAAIGGLVVAVTLGAMVGGFASTGSIGICTGRAGDAGTANAPDQGGDFGATAQVAIEQACGDLDVTTMAGSSWSAGLSADDRGASDLLAIFHVPRDRWPHGVARVAPAGADARPQCHRERRRGAPLACRR